LLPLFLVPHLFGKVSQDLESYVATFVRRLMLTSIALADLPIIGCYWFGLSNLFILSE
jgi:hypothetical protein